MGGRLGWCKGPVVSSWRFLEVWVGIGLRWRRSEEATQGCSRELPGAEPILKGLPSRVSLVANELVGGSPSHLDLCVCVCVCVCVKVCVRV